jgi:isopenicillin N synthase-like dioxygenase
MLAIALNKKEDYFDAWFQKECSSSFRVIHYLPRSSIYAAKSDKLD